MQQQQVRATMAAAQQASAKNRRLAQQMANRPAVIAALKLKKVIEADMISLEGLETTVVT